jgi:hypothetical protein
MLPQGSAQIQRTEARVSCIFFALAMSLAVAALVPNALITDCRILGIVNIVWLFVTPVIALILTSVISSAMRLAGNNWPDYVCE